MMTVELIYDRDCPNVPDARANLVRALTVSGRESRWTEWDRGAPDSPPRVRGYGSPTVLVDGKDVAGEAASAAAQDGEGPSCRLYRKGAGRSSGVPAVEQIASALVSQEGVSGAVQGGAGWKTSLAAAPGIAFAFLPKVACPACWPAYAGLLSALGLGFLLEEAWLLPLTAAFLVLVVGALAVRARTRRGYGPFGIGLAAGIAVLVGKFALDSDAAMYGGIAALVAASVWNGWPACRNGAACPACVSVSSALQKETSS
jgi:mercuric ion transport protein